MADLNSMNLPTGEHELFDPENAWAGAAGRVVVQVNSALDRDVYQIGRGETGSYWIRLHAAGVWGDWQELVPPPPPPGIGE